jgi:hypothetical protein
MLFDHIVSAKQKRGTALTASPKLAFCDLTATEEGHVMAVTQCPQWVNRVILNADPPLLVFPDKQTSSETVGSFKRPNGGPAAI